MEIKYTETTDRCSYNIYNEDNTKTLSRLKDNSIDGIITSPPYNICTERSDMYYDIGYNDDLSESEYIDLRLKEFEQFERIVKSRGVVCYNISYHHTNPILPVKLISAVDKKTTYTVADVISWKKDHSIPFQTSPTKLSRVCEMIYVMVKKEHLHNFKTNKTVSSINKDTGQKFYKDYKNFIEAPNNDGIESSLKASFSTELVMSLIDMYFPIESTIYDPFCGISTTGIACKKMKRSFIGSEINTEHYETGVNWIKQVENINHDFW